MGSWVTAMIQFRPMRCKDKFAGVVPLMRTITGEVPELLELVWEVNRGGWARRIRATVRPAGQAIEAKPYIQKASTLQTMGSDQFHDYLFTYNKSILTNTCLYCKIHIRKWDHIIDFVWQIAFFTKSYILNIFPCENIEPCFAILNVGWYFLKGKRQSFSFLLQNNI